MTKAINATEPVGFNNKRYDNHILYGAIQGFRSAQLYDKMMNILYSQEDRRRIERYLGLPISPKKMNRKAKHKYLVRHEKYLRRSKKFSDGLHLHSASCNRYLRIRHKQLQRERAKKEQYEL